VLFGILSARSRNRRNYFRIRLVALLVRLRMAKVPYPVSLAEVGERVRDAVAEIARTISLGESLLHSLRRLDRRRQGDRISRA
jgi:hypothetical protein